MILYIHAIPPLALDVLEAGPQRTTLGGEVPTMSVSVDNARGEAAALLSVPPLRARASLVRGETTIFSGRVQSVALAEVATLTLEI